MHQGRQELHKLFANALRSASTNQAPVLAWPLVCGAGVANRTRAVRFDRGVLQIEVPDKPWAAQLEALAAAYLEALNKVVEKKVARIEFVIKGGQEPAARSQRQK